jgi:cytochrome c oxidase subunit 1
MFTTGLSITARLPFMVLTLAIAVPSGIKVFNWIATLWGGAIELKAPMLFAIGFIAMFVIGGINGVFQAPIPLDYSLQDTYWVVAHLHYVLFGGTILGVFAGFYFWFPRMSKRMYSERLARWHFGLTMVGLNLVFFTMHFLGLEGMPRRVFDYPPSMWTLNWLATLGAFVVGAGQLVFVTNVVWTFVKGIVSDTDPWGEIPAQKHEARVPGVPIYAMPIHGMPDGGSPSEPSDSERRTRAP